MKKHFLIFISLIAALSSIAQSQPKDSSSTPTIIFLNAFSLMPNWDDNEPGFKHLGAVPVDGITIMKGNSRFGFTGRQDRNTDVVGAQDLITYDYNVFFGKNIADKQMGVVTFYAAVDVGIGMSKNNYNYTGHTSYQSLRSYASLGLDGGAKFSLGGPLYAFVETQMLFKYGVSHDADINPTTGAFTENIHTENFGIGVFNPIRAIAIGWEF